MVPHMTVGSALWIAKPVECELEATVYHYVHFFFMVRVFSAKFVLNILYFYHIEMVLWVFLFNNTT